MLGRVGSSALRPLRARVTYRRGRALSRPVVARTVVRLLRPSSSWPSRRPPELSPCTLASSAGKVRGLGTAESDVALRRRCLGCRFSLRGELARVMREVTSAYRWHAMAIAEAVPRRAASISTSRCTVADVLARICLFAATLDPLTASRALACHRGGAEDAAGKEGARQTLNRVICLHCRRWALTRRRRRRLPCRQVY